MNPIVNDLAGPRALTSGEMNAVSGGTAKPPFSSWPNSGGAFFDRDTNTGVVFDTDGYWIGQGGRGVTFYPY
jgi:hypothetical protein